MKLRLFTNIPTLYNDISEAVRAWMDVEEIELLSESEQADLIVLETVGSGTVSANANMAGKTGASNGTFPSQDDTVRKRICRRTVKVAVYNLFLGYTGRTLPWGSLTGIRPTKLYREYGSPEALRDVFDLPLKKGRMLEEICQRQQPFLEPEAEEVDVYVGIPFCRTRCIYCSFSATDATKGRKVMVPYVAALGEEIEDTARLIRELGKRVRCVYIGGGTPTALEEDLFETMLTSVNSLLPPTKEFTVEAGRPDTITPRKLQVMKQNGVNRISINPQSMNDETLQKIGRAHTAQQIVDCFALARTFGFETINCDLIAGLPEETPDMFFYTLEEILQLAPENITVHTLALKKGSLMAEKGYQMAPAEDVQQMVEGARTILMEKGYAPYYLYRQKYMTGNFENVGYTQQGHEGIYNIDIMEETTDILALGAGASSKRIYREEDRIERVFNIKNINEYIRLREERLNRKRELFR